MTSKPQENDVIVVGAGIIGIACAHYLHKVGMQVTVMDRGTIGGACSYGNCGYVCPSHVLPLTEPGAVKMGIKSLFKPNAPFRIKPRISPTLWRWLWEFARRCNHKQMMATAVHLKSILDSSMDEYRQLMASEPIQCEWEENGLLYVLKSDEGMHEFAKTDKLLTDNFGVSAQRIEGADLPAFDPSLKPGLAGGYHYTQDASVRPDLLNTQWAQRLADQGVRFIEQCELQTIVTSSDNVKHLQTSHGKMTAKNYVFATGAWSPKFTKALGCKIPVQPGKGYSVTMDRPDPCPQYPILFPEHRVGVSPFENGYRLGSMMEFAGFDTSIPDRRIAQLQTSAEPYLITPSVQGEKSSWFGWRPMTWDSLPIIGRVPSKANAYLATGHNMLGVSLATATGRLIAELIQDIPTHINASPYSPHRF